MNQNCENCEPCDCSVGNGTFFAKCLQISERKALNKWLASFNKERSPAKEEGPSLSTGPQGSHIGMSARQMLLVTIGKDSCKIRSM